MKKIFLAAILVAQVFVANAQSADTKPYEEKMNKIESEFNDLQTAYKSAKKIRKHLPMLKNSSCRLS